jgi:hypothetical protein
MVDTTTPMEKRQRPIPPPDLHQLNTKTESSSILVSILLLRSSEE